MRTVYPEPKRTFEWSSTSRRSEAHELASWVPAIARRILPPEPRGGEIPFGPVIAVPPGAAPYVQLAAWLGRQP
jgi:hypothetical protein